MRKQLDELLQAAREVDREKLPRLLADLREIELIALARFNAPPAAKPAAELLDIEATAQRMKVSRSYLYRNAGKFSFTRHEGSRLLFHAGELEKYLAAKR